MSHDFPFLVRESHLDTFGHVNNATYLRLFEDARWQLITEGGFGLEHVRKSGLGPVILEVHLKFKKEIFLRQTITIRTELLSYEGKIGHIKQVMLNEQNEECCAAEFVFGLWDTKIRKLIEPTPEWARAVGHGLSDQR